MNSEWREISEGYIVSSEGQVVSRKFGRVRALAPCPNGTGYMQVCLCVGGGTRRVTIHKLVAEAFLGPRPSPKHEVNHKNGIKSDNRAANLEWMTRSQNLQHRRDVLGYRAARGEANSHVKLTEDGVREIRARCAAGENRKDVARDFGIHKVHVGLIVRRKTWAWLA